MLSMNKKNKPAAGRPSEWSKKKLTRLKNLYPATPNDTIAEILSKEFEPTTVSAIRNAAIRYKLKKTNRYWDKPEEKYLLVNWQVMSPEEIAVQLKRRFKFEKTKWAVINKYRELTGKR